MADDSSAHEPERSSTERPSFEPPSELSSKTNPQRPAAPARAQARSSDEHSSIAEDVPFLRRIDHFKLLEQIGTGGMGRVYRALDEKLDREVALKIVRRDRLKPEQIPSRRFIEEARLTAKLDHPYIVPIYEIGTSTEQETYFTMKLIEGETLDELVHKAGAERLAPARLENFLQILVRVCEALGYAHSRGVVHCDLKPSNIMIGSFGQVYLMDWGIALLTEGSEDVRTNAGTPQFMPPEQAQGQTTDARSDLFSLGATLYFMVTGSTPYETLDEAARGEYLPPQSRAKDRRFPVELREIILRAMAPNPAERYASVAEMQSDLESFLRGSWQPRQVYASGERIIHEGDEAHTAFVIARGRCEVVDLNGPERIVLRELGPGDTFGESALLSQGTRTATVEAVEETEVVVIHPDKDTTQEADRTSPTHLLIKTLAERFRAVDRELRMLKASLLDPP